MHVCMYVCFSRISHDLEHLENPTVVSCCSPVNSPLHRHDIRMRFLTSARHVKIGKKCLLKGAFKKVHVNLSSSILSVRKTGVT